MIYPLCPSENFIKFLKTMTREYLENYLLLSASIKRCQKKLNRYLTRPLIQVHGVIEKSMSQYPYIKVHETISGSDIKDERNDLIRQLVIEIADNQKKYETAQIYIDLWLESIEDLQIKEILSLRYCDNLTYPEIGRKLGYEQSTIAKKIDNFFKIQEIQDSDVVI